MCILCAEANSEFRFALNYAKNSNYQQILEYQKSYDAILKLRKLKFSTFENQSRHYFRN